MARTTSREASKGMAEHAVTFTYKSDTVPKKVSLVGDFNDWDPKATPMTKRNGTFQKSIQLAPGQHQYKFVVDGVWQPDPSSPGYVEDGFGGMNSVVNV